MMNRIFNLPMIAVAAAALTACGGGGSDSDNQKLKGTVAQGAPLAKTTVQVVCQSGTDSTRTDAQGKYEIDLSKMTLPCTLSAAGQTADKEEIKLKSLTNTSTGISNITTFTTLAYELAAAKGEVNAESIAKAWAEQKEIFFTIISNLRPEDQESAKKALSASPFFDSFNANGADPLDKIMDDFSAAGLNLPALTEKFSPLIKAYKENQDAASISTLISNIEADLTTTIKDEIAKQDAGNGGSTPDGSSNSGSDRFTPSINGIVADRANSIKNPGETLTSTATKFTYFKSSKEVETIQGWKYTNPDNQQWGYDLGSLFYFSDNNSFETDKEEVLKTKKFSDALLMGCWSDNWTQNFVVALSDALVSDVKTSTLANKSFTQYSCDNSEFNGYGALKFDASAAHIITGNGNIPTAEFFSSNGFKSPEDQRKTFYYKAFTVNGLNILLGMDSGSHGIQIAIEDK